MMTTKQATEQLKIALRAKVGLIWIRSYEEQRVERTLIPIADEMGYELLTWTATLGIDSVASPGNGNDSTRDPSEMMKTTLKTTGRRMVVAYDLGAWLKDPMTLRTAKDTHRRIPQITDKTQAKQIVVVDPNEPPKELVGVTVIEWPLPAREDMGAIVDSFLEWAPEEAGEDLKKSGNKDDLVNAMMGLMAEDAASALSRSLAATGVFDPGIVASEKERIVKGSGLEWHEPEPAGFNRVGGVEVLKEWLAERVEAFGTKARDYGLPSPKGTLLLGIPGCGKSLICKAVAAAWGLPLLRLDVGAMFGKYVGDSESRIRTALTTAETVAPCVLWLDEVEKAFGGAGGGGETDGGTSARVFGTFLTWMQERKEGVFVIATSNNVKSLPAEFLRAGRWDEMWFVDLPNEAEREAIAEVMTDRMKPCAGVDTKAVAAAAEGYTGAEIEQAFIDAMHIAYKDKARKVRRADVIECLSRRIPLAKTMAEQVAALREWAQGRARTASKQTKRGGSRDKARAIEIG